MPKPLIRLLGITLLIAIAGWSSPDALAGISTGYIHESAQMGPTASSSPIVSFGDQGNAQFISATVFDIPDRRAGEVTAVGGHMGGGNQSTELLYAAILQLAGSGSAPSEPGDSNPFGNSTIVAADAFGPPQGSNSRDVRVPMATTLDAGSYALVFGAGGTADELLFGPGGFVQPSGDDITDGSLAGFILAQPGPLTDTILRWNSLSNTWMVDSSNNDIRLYVEGGIVIPEPASLALLGLGVVGLAGYRRRIRR